jgi:hypothetical protein
LSFSGANIVGSITEHWEILQYGLFGMPVFMAFLVYLIIRFKAFNIKLLATQALVWGLAILIGAQFFFIKITLNMVLNGVTFVGVIIFGYLLIRSVKKEVQQKEELAKLNLDLQKLIKERESLMHLINHKVKGAFTHSKYIFSEMLDGTFGAISPELKKMAANGLESDNIGINTVDLVLNATNMQKGLIKYDLKTTDLNEIVQKVLVDKTIQAEARGLKFKKEIKAGKLCVSADSFWIKEAINNLIDNAIKYTQAGTITVGLKKVKEKILFSVKDTGVGITEEDKKNLFTEGGRGKDSVKINVDSTGYGLYSAKKIVEAHQGRVWAESAGEGKGSTFYIELTACK